MISILPVLLPLIGDLLKRVIPDPHERARVQADIEAQAREADARVMEAQAAAFKDAMALAVAETEKPGWWSAWRPAFAWLFVVALTLDLVAGPLLKAAVGVAIEVPAGTLTQLGTVFLTLYMGGHTAKYVADQWKEGRQRP
jgi:hypothetical protein